MKIVLDKNWNIVDRALRNPYAMDEKELSNKLLWEIFSGIMKGMDVGKERLTEPMTLLHYAALNKMTLSDICEPLWYMMTGRWDGVCIPCNVFKAFCDLRLEDGRHYIDEKERELERDAYWDAVCDERKLQHYL